MQLRIILAERHGFDTLVVSGTGSGKTLPMALTILLDDQSWTREVFETVEWEHLYQCSNFQGNQGTVRPSVHPVADQEGSLRRIEVEKGSFPLSTILPDRQHNCMSPERDELPNSEQHAVLQGTKEHVRHRDLQHVLTGSQ